LAAAPSCSRSAALLTTVLHTTVRVASLATPRADRTVASLARAPPSVAGAQSPATSAWGEVQIIDRTTAAGTADYSTSPTLHEVLDVAPNGSRSAVYTGRGRAMTEACFATASGGHEDEPPARHRLTAGGGPRSAAP
jgi:hypothetical protein